MLIITSLYTLIHGLVSSTVDSRWIMPHLDDKSIILIAAVLAFIIIVFILILVILFCRMKRNRAKQGKFLCHHQETTLDDLLQKPSIC